MLGRLPVLRRLLVTTGGVASLRAAGVLVQYGLNIYLAQLLPATEISSFWLCTTIVILTYWVAGFGFQSGAVRFLPGYLEDRDYARARGFGWALLGATTVGPMAVWLAAAALLPLVDHPDSPVLSAHLTPSGVLLVCSCLMGGLSEMIRATHRPVASLVAPTVLVPALTLAAVVLFVEPDDLSATTLLWLSAASALVGCIFQAIVLAILPETSKARTAAPRFDVRVWVSRSAALGVFALLWNLSQTIDFLVVGASLPAEEVAIYGALLKVLAAQHLLSSTIMSAAGSRLSQLVVARSPDLKSEVEHISVLLTGGMAAVFLFFVISGDYLLQLFGPQFRSGHSVLCILSFGLVVRSAFGPCEALLMYADRSRATIVGSTVGSAITAITSFILAPLLGIGAVAVVTVASFLAVYAYFYLCVRKALGLDPSIVAVIMSKRSVPRQ